MKCLSERIARMANAEDNCKGRFWEGRFKCQALLNENAMLAACAYVDLNPIRAGIASSVTRSKHTGIVKRAAALAARPTLATQALAPLAGIVPREFSQDYPSRLHRPSRLDRSTATPRLARQNRYKRAAGIAQAWLGCCALDDESKRHR